MRTEQEIGAEIERLHNERLDIGERISRLYEQLAEIRIQDESDVEIEPPSTATDGPFCRHCGATVAAGRCCTDQLCMDSEIAHESWRNDFRNPAMGFE